MRNIIIVTLLCNIILQSYSLFADSSNKESSTHNYRQVSKDLVATQNRLEQYNVQNQKYNRDLIEIERDLLRLREEMVSLTAHNRRISNQITANRENLSALLADEQLLLKNLEEQKEEQAHLISAMAFMQNSSAQNLLLIPKNDKYDENYINLLAIAFDGIYDSLAIKSIEIADSKNKIRNNRFRIREAQAILQEEADLLTENQRILANHLQTKQELRDKTNKRQQKMHNEILKLSEKALTLKELIETVEQARAEHVLTVSKPQYIPNSKPKSFTDAKGSILFPAIGRVVEKFGKQKNLDGRNSGITIKAKEFSQVVAPFYGTVVFSGPFLGYGNMVIIRHNGGFHSMISGMEDLLVIAGEDLMEGEPIGNVGSKEENKLYYELRYKSKPVDPMDWLGQYESAATGNNKFAEIVN